MGIEVKGGKKVIASFQEFGFDLDKILDDEVVGTAFRVQRNATVAINTQSQGKPIRKSKGVVHIQSKPGDAPNTDEGRLVGSINVVHRERSKVALVGTNLDYGFFLETVHNRPWLEPAKNAEIKGFGQRVTDRLRREIAKAGK